MKTIETLEDAMAELFWEGFGSDRCVGDEERANHERCTEAAKAAIRQFVADAATAEREACAALVESMCDPGAHVVVQEYYRLIAAAIRARD